MGSVVEYILSLPRWGKRLVAVALDSVFTLIALWVSFSLQGASLQQAGVERSAALAAVTVIVTLLTFVRLGLYRAIIRFVGERAVLAILLGIGASMLTLCGTALVLGVELHAAVPVTYSALALFFLGGSRLVLRFVANGRPQVRSRPLVAIIGAGETGLQLFDALRRGVEYRPAFFISFAKDKADTTLDGLPVFPISKIEQALAKYPVSRLLLALDEDSHVDRVLLLKSLEPLAVPVQTVPRMSELISGSSRINDIRELDVEDLLGRDPVRASDDMLSAGLRGKSVLVSGAGGSIGSELCRQILRQKPKSLVLFEMSEFALYAIEKELSSINMVEGLGVNIQPILGSVTHRKRCESVMRSFNVEAVYHAAAYKHVPLVEYNVIEGVQNNVFGTWHIAEAAIASGVERFVLVSTDKAVRPTNVMGASKRLAELVLQGLAQRQSSTVFSMVRFGNVLGSSGSVVPLFRDQVRDGGPITVTHPDIIRYFMTIPEASQLVLQAGAMGREGEVFVLDMGEPVKIADLARKIINLMGFSERTEENPDGDIEIVYSGLRPGEKLYEELLIGNDPQGTAHPRIMKAKEVALSWGEVSELLDALAHASKAFDCDAIIQLLLSAPTGYSSKGGTSDLVWQRRQAAEV